MAETRICPKCEKAKPLREFRRNAGYALGLQSWCISCCTQKVCTKCGKTKPLSEFYANKATKDKHTSWCMDCTGRAGRERNAAKQGLTLEQYDAGREQKKDKVAVRVKHCIMCRQKKPLGQFAKSGWSEDGHSDICKKCTRGEYLRTEYGLSLEIYGKILDAQGGGCSICGKTPKQNGKRLAVDHNHKTGAIRGLLCTNCNLALGYLKDSPERCRRAAEYLEHPGNGEIDLSIL